MTDTQIKTNRIAKNAGLSAMPRHKAKLEKIAKQVSKEIGETVTPSTVFQKVTDNLTLHDVIQLFTIDTKPQ